MRQNKLGLPELTWSIEEAVLLQMKSSLTKQHLVVLFAAFAYSSIRKTLNCHLVKSPFIENFLLYNKGTGQDVFKFSYQHHERQKRKAWKEVSKKEIPQNLHGVRYNTECTPSLAKLYAVSNNVAIQNHKIRRHVYSGI